MLDQLNERIAALRKERGFTLEQLGQMVGVSAQAVSKWEKGGAPEGYANYEFLIKDTGIGMSEEFVAHIFEPFEREQNATLSGIEGTGLGMAITKNIVDMMNGFI